MDGYGVFGAFCGVAVGAQVGKLVHLATGSFAAGLIALAVCVVAGVIVGNKM